MKTLFALAFVALNLSAAEYSAPTATAAPGLSGNYKLSYLVSDLASLYRSDESKKKEVESFNFEKIAPAPIPAPLYLYHNPIGPSATLMGGGSDAPRFCEGQAEMLSQTLECSPLSEKAWKDEKTGCGFNSIFIETVLYDIIQDLRYSRTEVFIFDKDTEKECQEYKSNLASQLEEGTAPDFFKAMKKSGVVTDLKDLPDGFVLSHIYQMTATDEKAIDLPEGNVTGAYSVTYAGKSRTESWLGDKKEQLEESQVFDSKSERVPVEQIGTVLFFHDLEKGTLKIAAGGQNKTRTCKKTSKEDEKNEVFTCTLFKAKEEELGTGCTIEHWLKEEVILTPGENPRYARVEERRLSGDFKEGCENYRKKVASELSEGSAELFFRVLLKTGGIKNPERMGDNFKLIHEYTVTPES